jgi:hypothetical protein
MQNNTKTMQTYAPDCRRNPSFTDKSNLGVGDCNVVVVVVVVGGGGGDVANVALRGNCISIVFPDVTGVTPPELLFFSLLLLLLLFGVLLLLLLLFVCC